VNLLSIVIPTYNEKGNLVALFSKIQAACISLPFEVIFVDDGSTDGTGAELRGLRDSSASVRVLTLRRNFGQTAAMAAGFDAAKGDIIVPLDADGQNDPADIPRLLAKMAEGYDVVSGWRKNRQDGFVLRKFPSFIANAIISSVTGVALHDYGCTLKAYRSDVIKDVQLFGDMHRFLPAWCAWQGGRVTEMPVNHFPRLIGKSKYGIFRTFKVIVDLITLKFFSGYLARPNHLFAGTGLVFLLLAACSGLFALYDKFGPDLFSKFRIPLLLMTVFFGLAALFLILMGLLAELLIRLYFQVSDRKTYRLKPTE
jgi:glycosyltransferase involved in cell wall biosynthesis